nr:hypothetical protein [uncultured Cohaesibacter sp.]
MNSKFLLIGACFLFSWTPARADLNSQLYKLAVEQYQQGDWEVALFLLERFQVEYADYLNDNPDKAKGIRSAVAYCSARIQLPEVSPAGFREDVIATASEEIDISAYKLPELIRRIQDPSFQTQLQALEKGQVELPMSPSGQF